jgi:heme-degrading monooxygenase HmoA
MSYVYIWRFVVRPGSEAVFEAAYGPDGHWMRLFREADGYLGTQLLCEQADARRYVTIDRWSSREAWEAFRAARAADWEALDLRCRALTEHEEEIGQFEELR